MQQVSVMATQGSLVQFAYHCPLYRVVGCPLFRGCLNIRVEWKDSRDFQDGLLCRGVSFKLSSTEQWLKS